MTAKQARAPGPWTGKTPQHWPRHEATGELLSVGEFMEWQDKRIQKLTDALTGTLFALNNCHKPECTIQPAIIAAKMALQK